MRISGSNNFGNFFLSYFKDSLPELNASNFGNFLLGVGSTIIFIELWRIPSEAPIFNSDIYWYFIMKFVLALELSHKG